jgi:phosphoglycolate phosphatase-like HAD superfamily hydrolase
MSCVLPDEPWIQKLVAALPPPPGVVVFDIDCSITDGNLEGALRPGVRELFAWMVEQDYTIVLWTGPGEQHALEVVNHHQLSELVSAIHGKAPFPMSRNSALAVLGVEPLLTIDDDESEAIDGWRFHLTERFLPKHTESEALPSGESFEF